MPQQIYGFGSFQLNVAERQLHCHASAIRLHAKVFDTLVVLLTGAGRLLRKEALMRAIWPNHVVEENNLQHNICVLRRVLAQHDRHPFIETVPGQGYRFAAKVQMLEVPTTETPTTEVPTVAKSAPALLAMQHRTTQGTTPLRSAPRWPAVPLSDAEQLAALSRRVDELRRCFRELAYELADVERHLQQKQAPGAVRVNGNLVLP